MKRLFVASTILAGALTAQSAGAATLDFTFLPPNVEEQDLCGPKESEPADDLSIGPSTSVLTNRDRLRFLRRDIRRYQTEDPDRWFDFIDALIARVGALDQAFDQTDITLARIALMVDAGRMAQLRKAGLVDALAAAPEILNNAQRMRLAQYLLNGIGTAKNPELAYELIREAGFAGNTDALLMLTRRMLDEVPVPGWDAPAELTVTMAFGGLLGPMDGGVCNRALRIADEYQTGGIMSRNEEVALAWIRFAADLGSANAAWRMVEHQLGTGVTAKDPSELLHYLRRAVERGITLDPAAHSKLATSASITAEELSRLLGYNFTENFQRRRPSLSKYFNLSVKPDAEVASESGPYLIYLREIVQVPSAPGSVYTELAKEILVRRGRWAGESDAMPLFEEAAHRRDPEGTRLLAKRLLRYRQDPQYLNRAIDLFSYASAQLGDAPSLQALDNLYRCQHPNAPQMQQAGYWADAYRAAAYQGVAISADDMITLDPYKDPWTLAELQSQALDGRPRALAGFLQLVQSDPLATPAKQRMWSDWADNSDKTMEEFAKFEFDLSGTPAERSLAIELFRRVYINNGVTTALDLAVALIDNLGRDPKVAEEIEQILLQASNRGEGASIRLLTRLRSDRQTEAEVYEEFRQIIDERGDFLALVLALPFIDDDRWDSYVDRAVSLMSCNTKDIFEMGEAFTRKGDRDIAFQWQKVSLALESGNVLAKLRLSDRQSTSYNTIAAPGVAQVAERAAKEVPGIERAQRLYSIYANSELDSYAPDRAATQFATNLVGADHDGLEWAVGQYIQAPHDLRLAIRSVTDLPALLDTTAEAGSPMAMEIRAIDLLSAAKTLAEVKKAGAMMKRAAEAGRTYAMAEWGWMLATGLGTPNDNQEAVEWLDKAAKAGHREAADLLRLLRLSDGG